jgi:GR25 family glycosyltransferase involved in LPS biosynthesis
MITQIDEIIYFIKNYKVKTINIINSETSLLNEKVSKIYVINMANDRLKRNYTLVLMRKYKINFTLVIVDKVTDEAYKKLCPKKHISRSELGCCLSHLWCLNNAIQNQYKNLIIFEDDVILHKNFVHHFDELYSKNEKIDFLLLGAQDYHFSGYNYKNLDTQKGLYYPNINKMKLYGAHANYYSLEGAKRMFLIRTSLVSFFDKEYNLIFEHFKKSSFICYPNLVVTNMTMSSLDHKHDFFSQEENAFYKNCYINFNFSDYNFIYINIFKKTIDIDAEKDDYETYVTRTLYYYFYNFDQIAMIKNRITLDFFTLEDVKQIMEI